MSMRISVVLVFPSLPFPLSIPLSIAVFILMNFYLRKMVIKRMNRIAVAVIPQPPLPQDIIPVSTAEQVTIKSLVPSVVRR